MLGHIHLNLPLRNLTQSTPRRSNSGNLVFKFDSSMPGVDCPIGCQELFVNVAQNTTGTLAQQWQFRQPVDTGRISAGYRVYQDRFNRADHPRNEILVPADTPRPQDEFYSCAAENGEPNPLCQVTAMAKNGLVAHFAIPRKVLAKARPAASFVSNSLDQFSDNHINGLCQ